MVDPALVYVGGVFVLFFFWIYGIVAFVRDVKNKLVPAYRQYRRGDEGEKEGPREVESPGDVEDPRDVEDPEAVDERRRRELYRS